MERFYRKCVTPRTTGHGQCQKSGYQNCGIEITDKSDDMAKFFQGLTDIPCEESQMDQDTNVTKPKSDYDYTINAIIGGATGGGILLIILTIGCCFCNKRRRITTQSVSKQISYVFYYIIIIMILNFSPLPMKHRVLRQHKNQLCQPTTS